MTEHDSFPQQEPALTRLFQSVWGVILALAVAATAGGAVAFWIAGLAPGETVSGVKSDVETMDRELRREIRQLAAADKVLADSIAAGGRQRVWIICTTVPPNRPDVLAALRVTCDYDSPTRRTIQGVPLLEEERRE